VNAGDTQIRSLAAPRPELDRTVPAQPRPATPWYEVLSKLTPLLIGICVTGTGLWVSTGLQQRQLELTQIQSLSNFLPKVYSNRPQECLSAFESFVGERFNELLIDIMDRTAEPCGRPRLQSLVNQTRGPMQQRALRALRDLPVQVFLNYTGDRRQGQQAKTLGKCIDAYGINDDADPLRFSYRGPIEKLMRAKEAPAQPEIRYFIQSDREEADVVAGMYARLIGGQPEVKFLPLMARPGTLEVWMPRPPDRVTTASLNC
jgi:hypothetical protein